MNCKKIREKLDPALLDEGQALPEEITRHLEGCESCRQWQREALRLHRALLDTHGPVAEVDVAGRVAAMLPERHPAAGKVPPKWGLVAAWAAGAWASGAVVTILVALVAWSGARAVAPEAAVLASAAVRAGVTLLGTVVQVWSLLEAPGGALVMVVRAVQPAAALAVTLALGTVLLALLMWRRRQTAVSLFA